MQPCSSSPHSIRHKTFRHQKVAGFVLDDCSLSLFDFENFDFYKINPHLSSNPKDRHNVLGLKVMTSIVVEIIGCSLILLVNEVCESINLFLKCR